MLNTTAHFHEIFKNVPCRSLLRFDVDRSYCTEEVPDNNQAVQISKIKFKNNLIKLPVLKIVMSEG